MDVSDNNLFLLQLFLLSNVKVKVEVSDGAKQRLKTAILSKPSGIVN
jgi:hypothetical protein